MSGRFRSGRADEISAATPPGRDRVVDAIRAASLLVVVVGHWLMAGFVVLDDCRVRGVNALEVLPGLQPLTWVFQVMPLFFVAGGYANARVWRRMRQDWEGYADYLRGRVIRLLWPVVPFAVIVQGALGVLWAAGMPTENLSYVARLLGSPLWFLVIYVVVTALAPAMLAWHRRRPRLALMCPAVGVLAVDVARMASGTDVIGGVNFVLVWLVAQQLGVWYADAHMTRPSPRVLFVVAGAVVITLLALTVIGPYPVSMVGLPGQMSNMNPPSVCLMLLGVGQGAVILAVRGRLAEWLDRPRPWAAVVGVGARGIELYLWHLPALVVLVALSMAVGVSLPPAGSVAWWLSRPVWIALLTGALVGLVVAVKWLGARRPVPGSPPRPAANRRVGLTLNLMAGVPLLLLGLIGYATTGLEPFVPAGRGGAGLAPAWFPSTLGFLLGWTLVRLSARCRPDQRYQVLLMYQPPSTLRRSKA